MSPQIGGLLAIMCNSIGTYVVIFHITLPHYRLGPRGNQDCKYSGPGGQTFWLQWGLISQFNNSKSCFAPGLYMLYNNPTFIYYLK